MQVRNVGKNLTENKSKPGVESVVGECRASGEEKCSSADAEMKWNATNGGKKKPPGDGSRSVDEELKKVAPDEHLGHNLG